MSVALTSADEDAAARLRRARAEDGELLLEEPEEVFGAEEERYTEAELWATLGGVLTAKELEITRALSEGWSQREAAERLKKNPREGEGGADSGIMAEE
ncbi:response regulator transcription factor [Cloacibacillus porcorum]|uniref:response regulator transcription factor n=1 Tax=Cloacibacillus porcorum TaxID=1197717 RepID=UPI001459E193|nr:response regulator transcription factor [Cloacibacillus porcorum]MCC8184524.1 hypothetical protein [Cloacibacillus porcorum]MDY5389211.1 response regulator transcription factor [Cloacibacillus porcorum]NMF19164.1 response regulator transcription factor [Cloacibacillus porcorum]